MKRNVPFIHNTDELQEYIRSLYIIEDYLGSTETYQDFRDKLNDIVQGCYTIRECREFPIKFKFYKQEKETHSLELRHFLINVFLWAPLVEIQDPQALNESFICDCYNGIENIDDYINNVLISTLRDYHIKSTKINFSISDVIYSLRSINLNYSDILNLSFDMKTFLDMYNGDSRFHKIMNYDYPDNAQPYDIEQILKKLQNEFIDLLKAEPENPIGVILRSGTGIKHKQLIEFAVSQGLKPTLTGETIPIQVKNSILINGTDRPSYWFINGLGARKSMVMNKKVMGKAGYFGKIVVLLARTLSMTTEVLDCQTKHLVKYELKNKSIIKKMHGKYYKMHPSDPELKVFNAAKSMHLLGQSIYVRSPITCALGDDVCPICVGRTSAINFDIARGLSAFESEEITKVINQSVLSAKHLLTTISEKIAFNGDLHKFFSCVAGEIYPLINDNPFVDNINDYAIYINPDDIDKVDEMDDDSLFNTMISNGKLYIRNIKNPNVEDILIETVGNKEIYITEEATELLKNNKGIIPFSEIDDDTKLFEIVIMNNELTKPLYALMDLLNKNRHDTVAETIDSIAQKLLDLLVESDIKANVVASELIINRLIRSVKNPYERPDFTQETLEPYDIYTVNHCLERNKSPLIGIVFQNVKRQLISDNLYTDRTAPSYVDHLFMEQVDTKNIKRYKEIVESNKSNNYL